MRTTGRNTETCSTRRASCSRRPSATADLPVKPSTPATYTLCAMASTLSRCEACASADQEDHMGELTPYLAVRDAREAISWYVEHLGAEVVYDPIVMPDGRIGQWSSRCRARAG